MNVIESPVYWVFGSCVLIGSVIMLFYSMSSYYPIFYSQDTYNQYRILRERFGPHDSVTVNNNQIVVSWKNGNRTLVDRKTKKN